MSLIRVRLIFVTLALFFAVPAINAQFRAGVQGTITDASGALIPEAKVVLTNKETGRVHETTSSEDGFYRLSGLPPGGYKLAVEKAGYKQKVLDNVTINAEAVQGLDVALETGDVTATVTVSAEASSPLETENANINKALTTREILRLPQVGRDPYELARLTPGVFGDGARGANGNASNLPNTTGPGGSNGSIFQTENQVQITANGQRLSANSFQIDGVSVNSQTWGGAAVITPSQEAVKEVRVLSSTYSAEDGRNTGANIKVVTQNGTNDFHGSVFFKYDEPGLNARNKFNGIRVENKFRQYGGSLGGPIARNKLFFFFTFEGLRSSSNVPFDTWVETTAYRQLVRNLRPNSLTARVFAAEGIEPRILATLPATCAFGGFNNPAECQAVSGGLDIGSPFGAANQYVPFSAPIGGGLDNIADIQFVRLASPSTFRGKQFNTRIDYSVTSNDNLAVTTYFTPTRTVGADNAGKSRPMSDLVSERFNWAAAAIYTRTISAALVNEARFNVTRWSFDEVASNPDANFGIPRIEVEGLPFDRIRFGVNRSEGTPGVYKETQLDFRDTLNWVKGNHAFKFGGEFRKELNDNSLIGGARPLYSFVRLWNLANDTPIFEAINADPSTGAPAEGARKFRGSNYGFFVQDDWKYRPNVTFNLGLRWEYFSTLRDSEGQQSNLFFGPNGLVDSRVEVVDSLYNPDRNNFGPQLGFAWSPSRFNEKAVIRGGFGIGYNRLPNAIFLNSRGNPPFFARFNICCGTAGPPADGFGTPFVDGQILYALGSSSSPLSYPTNPILGQGIDPVSGAPVSGSVEIYGSPGSQPNAYSYRYSLEGQYELPAKLTATLGYQGSATHKLVRIVNQNFIFAQTNPKFFAVYIPTPDVNSNYNAMNARLSRRFSNGFQFDGIYRWAKSIDTLSYEGPGAVTNQTFPVNNSTERGPSDFDVKHNFVFSALWDLPIFRQRQDMVGKILGGWQVNTIITAHSGFPWTPKIGRSIRSQSGDFFGPVRPIAYFGGAGTGTSNDVFLSPNGNFPGGGAHFFSTTLNGNPPTFLANPPGIGRNVFRGPRYRSIDLSLVKRFGLPSSWLREGAGLELRANFFNAFNQLNLAPFGFFDDSVFVDRSRFGQAINGLAGRVIELQARFNF